MELRLLRHRLLPAIPFAVVLLSCSNGGPSSPTPAASYRVTLAWTPNHETGVNSAGGGYQVEISGRPTMAVPYESGTGTPSLLVTALPAGIYSVTVRGYAALDALGGNAGSLSAPSDPVTVIVPRDKDRAHQ